MPCMCHRGEMQNFRQRYVACTSGSGTSRILTKIMFFVSFSIFFRLTCRGTPRSTGAMWKLEVWPGRRRGSKGPGTSCNSWLVGIGIDIYACVFRACTTDSRVPARAGHCWPRNSTGWWVGGLRGANGECTSVCHAYHTNAQHFLHLPVAPCCRLTPSGAQLQRPGLEWASARRASSAPAPLCKHHTHMECCTGNESLRLTRGRGGGGGGGRSNKNDIQATA